jgi:hypothetical protein
MFLYQNTGFPIQLQVSLTLKEPTLFLGRIGSPNGLKVLSTYFSKAVRSIVSGGFGEEKILVF